MNAYPPFILTLVFSVNLCIGQQIADSAFTYVITRPSYSFGQGPVITLDEAHYNFHTLDGRYMPFGKFLAQDGYHLRSGTEPFSKQELAKSNILVIANALPDDGDWVLPTKPAFTKEEVRALKKWVKSGGSLFLIADHMPFPGAALDLAAAFGFTFINGFAMRKDNGAEVFSRQRGNLHASPVTDGRNTSKMVDSVRVFTGQGFIAPPKAYVFLTLDSSYIILSPQRAWEFDDSTPSRSGTGHVVGACMKFGKGKIVVMGEAAMFTAQLAGPQRQRVGMNHPSASQNPQLLLNIIHWLDGRNE